MRGEGVASVMEALTLTQAWTQGFIFAVALMTVVSASFLLKMGRKEEEEEKHDDGLADGPKIRVDRGKKLAQTVRMVMRLKRKMRRFKERRNVQNKTD